jgi:AhpD family alkylhydroperoxidase
MHLVQHLIDFGRLSQEGVDPALSELIRIRASQINGCAACLYFHLAEARKIGVSEEKIILLSGWWESPVFSARERAALEWTEALTQVADHGAPDEAYAALLEYFSEDEVARMTLMIAAVNAFNRVNVGFHVQHPVALVRKSA